MTSACHVAWRGTIGACHRNRRENLFTTQNEQLQADGNPMGVLWTAHCVFLGHHSLGRLSAVRRVRLALLRLFEINSKGMKLRQAGCASSGVTCSVSWRRNQEANGI